MRVVVTGLGCVTPVGNDTASLWDSLIHGRHGFAPITKFDASVLKTRIAAEVKGFEPEKYLNKSDLRKTDLYAQYALAAASQAMEDSGLGKAEAAPDRLGVYIGSGIGGMATFMKQTEVLLTKGPTKISPHFIPMMIGNIASALIAIRYNAQGPNLPVVSACATATHSIGEAFRTIQHGHADVIIAGGAEAAINPLCLGGFINCLALSPSNDVDACSLPFDRRREGFALGEGAGALVLEEYEHAVRRGARIYCEVAGYANTCDAYHVTAPHPDAVAASRPIALALREAGLVPDELLYINAHGTGTPLNDKTETVAIKMALGDAAYQAVISSTKSMTGHMLGAAGAVEAIAAIKTLETGVIPPTIGLLEPDPDCDLDYAANTARERPVNKAMSLSMGFGGHNAGVLFTRCEAKL
jgi:3-oxoacyl-[acyl-carrier-protein] synthase II